ncbi:TlpA family protein disulfide reductase [Gelidibacter salicanalis]|uniref:Redoxin domain-containing protein n=1 Tax=Gelidibacter salicanalis TaxID=291193 RepID=A0A934NJ69_9FLAO|nr:TlpA disulfide reductase family protein [Gelidibacter salicanalis]MBJ7880949.1 redoxin domain-containing protein [Gelidibacter salicanalis]
MKKIMLLLVFLPTLLLAQHSIEGTFSPAKDFTYAFVYKSNPTGSIYMDRAKVDDNGHFKIELDSTSTTGIYKIVYGIPQQDHNFDLIYNGKEDVVLEFSLTDGLEFKESNENKLWASYTNSIEMINRAISNFYTQQSEDQEAFKDIFKTLNETQEAFELASKNAMVSVFIQANQPYIPETYEDVSTYSKNLKNSYLKNVDFSNPLLQSSEFLSDRVMAYVFGMTPSPTEAFYKQQIDNLTSYIGPENSEIKMVLLQAVWNNMVQIEESGVANYIADTYLLDLAKKENNDMLLRQLNIYKNTALGTVARDFPIEVNKSGKKVKSSLHALNAAEHYVLVFWSSECSHCLTELPQVRDMVDQMPKNKVKVVAYGLEDNDVNWKKEIQNYPDFIQVLGVGKWDNFITDIYGIEATPTYFVLDKDKKIIAKPQSLLELKTFLNTL